MFMLERLIEPGQFELYTKLKEKGVRKADMFAEAIMTMIDLKSHGEVTIDEVKVKWVYHYNDELKTMKRCIEIYNNKY